MGDIIKKSVLILAYFSIMSCFCLTTSWARLVVQAEVVSGNITHKYENNAVKLNNGKTYQPSQEGLSIDLPVGEPVTLRIVEGIEKNVFFEFAPGLNSLEKLESQLPKEETGQK